MRAILLAALLFCTGAAALGASWQEELTALPGPFPAFKPFKAQYRFGWSVFTAAEADFDLSNGKSDVSRIAVTARSIGAVRSMWRMNVEHVATMQTSTFRPIAIVQNETYKAGPRKTRVDFSPTGVSRIRDTIPPSGKAKTKTFDYPDVYDLHSALQFIRSQKLAAGDIYKLVVYPASAPYLAEAIVEGRQKLKAAGHSYNAVRLGLKLSKIDDDFELQVYDKFKRANVWISDDSDRLLLRIEAEIFVGSVWAELTQFELKK